MKAVAGRPFMLGVAHQGKDIQQMLGMGLKWARPVYTPYPYAQDGSLSREYVEYRNELRRLHAGGMKIISISPQPRVFIEAGIMPVGEEALRHVRQVCRFVAEDLADCVSAWQIGNELCFVYFRAPLSDDEACDFIIQSMLGMREGNPNAMLGHNSLDDLMHWLPWCRRIEEETGGSDYLGFDLYAGSWSPGWVETYVQTVDKLYDALHLPVLLAEFGYASKGEVADDLEADMIAWLKERGFDGYADMENRLEELIGFLPEQMQNTMRRAGNKKDQLSYLYQSKSHILHKWWKTSPWPHTEDAQREFFDQLLGLLIAHPHVIGAIAFKWQDNERCFPCGSADCPCETAWGLVRRDGSEKPAADVFRKYAGMLQKEANKGEKNLC